MTDTRSVFDRIVELLNRHSAVYQTLEHEPVFTSEEAARVRGTTLASGAKALVCKADQTFVMFVLSADRKLASKAIRAAQQLKSLRFATADEVLALTGLKPGSIPPFGSLFKVPTYCDQGLAEQPTINFNAGDHARSVSLAFAEYARIEQPQLGTFAE